MISQLTRAALDEHRRLVQWARERGESSLKMVLRNSETPNRPRDQCDRYVGSTILQKKKIYCLNFALRTYDLARESRRRTSRPVKLRAVIYRRAAECANRSGCRCMFGFYHKLENRRIPTPTHVPRARQVRYSKCDAILVAEGNVIGAAGLSRNGKLDSLLLSKNRRRICVSWQNEFKGPTGTKFHTQIKTPDMNNLSAIGNNERWSRKLTICK